MIEQPDQPLSHPPASSQSPAEPRERTVGDVMRRRVERRRERIRAEIRRNRAGGHKIPTWVLATLLGLILLGWLYIIVTQ